MSVRLCETPQQQTRTYIQSVLRTLWPDYHSTIGAFANPTGCGFPEIANSMFRVAFDAQT
jgi:hypothetical protein